MATPKPALWARAASADLVAPFSKVFAPNALAHGFARVAKAGGGPGADRQSIAAFALDARSGIEQLSQEILSGSYQPRRLLRHNLKKPDGGTRQLAIPAVRDRIAQAALTLELDAAFDPVMSRTSFAYRRGLSVQHALALVTFWQLRGFSHALDADIAGFFDNVPHAGVISMLKGVHVCPHTTEIIHKWLKIHGACGLPQGSPLSPFLSNLYLWPLDHAIESKRFHIVRYADDFLVLTKSQREAEAAKVQVAAILSHLGLSLSPAKTRICRLDDGVAFLGRSGGVGWV